METKENIGKLIAEARKKKKMSQQELANLLYVSDKAVSNWETGKNYPDISSLKNISKYLDIDLLSLLANDKKSKLHKKIFFTLKILLSLIFIILFIYFIFNFNEIKYYSIKLDSETFRISNSNLVIGNNKVILNLGTIENLKDATSNYDVLLYYLDGNKKTDIIMQYDYSNLYLETNVSDNIYFNKYMLNNLNNLYLTINYYDKNKNENISEDIKLLFENDIKSNQLFYKLKPLKLKVNKRTITLLENNGYKKGNNNNYIKNYTEESKEIFLKYNLNTLNYSYISNEDKIKKSANYNIKSNILEYDIEYDNIVVEKFVYNEEITCLLGDCKNSTELIEEFFKMYNLIK